MLLMFNLIMTSRVGKDRACSQQPARRKRCERELGEFFFPTLKIIGFEEKETHGEKKDEGVRGCTKTQFPQDGPDFSAGAASNALRGFSGREEITEEEAGSNDQKNLDENALNQFFGWRHNDSSEGEAQKNV